jgi:hypothetical protein
MLRRDVTEEGAEPEATQPQRERLVVGTSVEDDLGGDPVLVHVRAASRHVMMA